VFAICKSENALCKVETTPAYTRLPWLVDENENIDLTICAIPKEVSKERIKAEFTSLMADKYEEYDQIYMDGSLKDDKVGFGIFTKFLKNPQYTVQNSKRS
jgi:hypothetical protein